MVNIVGSAREGLDRLPEALRVTVEHTLNGTTGPYQEYDLLAQLITLWKGAGTPTQLAEVQALLCAALLGEVSNIERLKTLQSDHEAADALVTKVREFLDKADKEPPSTDVIRDGIDLLQTLDKHTWEAFIALLPHGEPQAAKAEPEPEEEDEPEEPHRRGRRR